MDSTNSNVVHLKSFGNAESGLGTNNSSGYNVVVSAVLTNNTTGTGTFSGAYFNSAPNSTISHFFAANNNGRGLHLNTAPNSNISQVVVVNNGAAGYNANADNLLNAQVVAAHNGDYGVAGGTTGSTYTGNLLVGNNTSADCYNGSGGGLSGTCGNQNGSTANLITGVNLASTFSGKVTTDDTSNTTDSSGTQTYLTTNDWYNLQNIFRTWGKDGSAFANADHRAACLSGTCRIWDWRLAATDGAILNKSGNGSTANQAWVDDANCPSPIHGNNTMTDRATFPNTYLINAIEILSMGGDDDGLCESNEHCTYSPNFGPYQGSGDYSTHRCNFVDGTVTGVKMYAYPTNGS